MEEKTRRPYRIAYRREKGAAQAEVTRHRIAEAARRRFGAAGYAATTMDAIAQEAGVAVQTVYANFPSKRSILEAILDGVHADAELARLNAVYDGPGRIRTRLRAGLAYVRRYLETYADVDRILRGAATAEPELAAHWHYDDQSRRNAAREAAAALAAEGVLRSGMGAREAADTLHLLTSPEIFDHLVGGSGWSPDEYERWLVMAVEALLTRHAPHPVLPEGPAR
jgi:TetR/AcrR family transcriptional regulator of autoinduction and epiphytic fitness